MLNRNDEIVYFERKGWNLGEERNLGRRELGGNLYSNFNHIENLVYKLNKSSQNFVLNKKKLEESILDLKKNSNNSNIEVSKYFSPKIIELKRLFNSHRENQFDNNTFFDNQMKEVGKDFNEQQNTINRMVVSLNSIDNEIGVDTNFF